MFVGQQWTARDDELVYTIIAMRGDEAECRIGEGVLAPIVTTDELWLRSECVPVSVQFDGDPLAYGVQP